MWSSSSGPELYHTLNVHHHISFQAPNSISYENTAIIEESNFDKPYILCSKASDTDVSHHLNSTKLVMNRNQA